MSSLKATCITEPVLHRGIEMAVRPQIKRHFEQDRRTIERAAVARIGWNLGQEC